MRYGQEPLPPWWFIVLAVILGLLALLYMDYRLKPEYMQDCIEAGNTRAQCEMSWKWHRYGRRGF